MTLLERLLGGMSVETFFAEYFEKRPIFIKGSTGRVKDILGFMLSSEDLPGLIRAASQITSSRVELIGFFDKPDQQPLSRSAADQLLRVWSPDTREFWNFAQGGLTTAFRVDDADPRIAELLFRFKQEVLWVGSVRASVWFSAPGAKMTPHIDGTLAFQIQLEGRKRWRLSRSVAVPWPRSAERVISGKAEYSLDGWETQRSAIDSSEWLDIVMEPGDVLFIPAGTWHATECIGDGPSLALGIVFAPRPFREVVLAMLEDAFEGDEAWRQPLPLNRDAGDKLSLGPTLQGFLNERLVELRAFLERVEPQGLPMNRAIKKVAARSNKGSDFMTAPALRPRPPVEERTRLTVPLAGLLRAASGRDASGEACLYVYSPSEEICFKDPRFIPFGLGLVQQRSFLAQEACQWADGEPYAWEEVRPLLEQLVEARVLEMG